MVALVLVTAVVLEYREKECMVPMSINRRIQRVMHFQIPLRSFEATVRLPPENCGTMPTSRRLDERSSSSRSNEDAPSSTAAYVSSSSPRSIPVSPIARKRVQLAFSNFSDDVLYQARDRLRQERAATLSGDRLLRVPHFNVQDCNEEIYLSCGKHCATKVRTTHKRGQTGRWGAGQVLVQGPIYRLCWCVCCLSSWNIRLPQVGPGMYRSVRATVPIQKHRFTYFEMTVNQPKSPFRIPGRASRNQAPEAARGGGNKVAMTGGSARHQHQQPGGGRTVSGAGNGEPSVCIGLSTRSMPLNTLVGASKYSVRSRASST